MPRGDYPPQYQPLLPEVTIPGEECLNLNVWTPDPTSSGLPVFVWIHGGSFMSESAGAMSVTTLLSMPQTRGLFRAAITHSGAGAHTMPPAIADRVTALLAEQLGVEPTHEAIAELAPELVHKAAEALTNEVQTAPDPATWGELALSLLPFTPTVDGTVLAQALLAGLAAGNGSDVALLTGTNAEESCLFLVAPSRPRPLRLARRRYPVSLCTGS